MSRAPDQLGPGVARTAIRADHARFVYSTVRRRRAVTAPIDRWVAGPSDGAPALDIRARSFVDDLEELVEDGFDGLGVKM